MSLMEAHPIIAILSIVIFAYFGWKMRMCHLELCRNNPAVRWFSIAIVSACLVVMIVAIIWRAAR
jgi:predicted tellurium resistance membrane protein TerC